MVRWIESGRTSTKTQEKLKSGEVGMDDITVRKRATREEKVVRRQEPRAVQVAEDPRLKATEGNTAPKTPPTPVPTDDQLIDAIDDGTIFVSTEASKEIH